MTDLLHGADLVRVRVMPDQVERATGALSRLPGHGGAEPSAGDPGWLTVRVAANRAAEVNRALAEAGIFADRLEAGSDLEDLFLALTADEAVSHEGTFQGISTAKSPDEEDR
jgi:hypothetical protein